MVDKPVDHRVPSLRFGPDRRLTAAAAGAALIALVTGLLTVDADGRLLAFGVAILALAYLVTDLVFTPRLAVDAAGLRINSPTVRTQLDWAQRIEIRHDTRPRHGIRGNLLEIDTGEVLVVFSRRALGRDPGQVAALIDAFRPPATR